MSSDFSEGGFRYSDLKERRIISSRSDLHDKQRKHGFPKPVKLGHGPRAAAYFPRFEVEQWLAGRAALRNNKIEK
jgi:predicted DNA-binding transcriptional regulator AlpA